MMTDQKLLRPAISEVILHDVFWKPYLENVRSVMLPYVFDKFEEKRYFDVFHQVTVLLQSAVRIRSTISP